MVTIATRSQLHFLGRQWRVKIEKPSRPLVCSNCCDYISYTDPCSSIKSSRVAAVVTGVVSLVNIPFCGHTPLNPQVGYLSSLALLLLAAVLIPPEYDSCFAIPPNRYRLLRYRTT